MCVCVCVTNHSIKHVCNIYIYMYLHVNCNILIEGQQHLFAGLSTFLSPPNTAFLFNTSVVMCTCCGTNLFHNCIFFFKDSMALKKHTPLFTKVPVYILSRFKFSFLTNIIHSIGCAAFSHINTEPPSISAKFTHSFLTKLHMNSQGVCCQSFNKAFFEKQNIVNIILNMNMYASILRLEDSSSFLQCLHLPFPTQHTFFHAKHLLLSSVHAVETPFSQRLLLFKGVP